ncbi:MAG: VWA domain-containing protein, partial [Phycisphaerales bacterium JB038]
DLRELGEETLDKARSFVNRFDEGGGTNIHDALQAAVKLLKGEDAEGRPRLIVFLTDGNGDRGRDPVMDMLGKAEAEGIAIFPFGVGHDVNTLLLDALATDYNGAPTYVQPGENLELVLGDFFATFSQPVLTNLELALPEMGAMDVFPPKLADLYHGQQVIVAGRMSEPTVGSVTLTALRRGEQVEYTWENVAFKHDGSATYVPRLWAGRKIGHLIDTIRRHGETQELVAEVVALSQAYGIQTPYASYLVAPERMEELALALEGTDVNWRGRPDADALRRREVQLRSIVREAGVSAPRPAQEAPASMAAGEDLLDFGEAEKAVTATAGRASNVVARVQQQLRAGVNIAEVGLDQRRQLVQNYNGRAYNYIDGFLIDQEMTEETNVTYIQFGSEAYFELARNRADLRPALAASLNTVVQINATEAVAVVDGESEQLQTAFTVEQRALLFEAAAADADAEASGPEIDED